MRAPVLLGIEEFAMGVVHALEHVGQPTDAGLGEHDLQRRIALQSAREDDGGQRLVHLQRRARDANAHVAGLRGLGPADGDGAQSTTEVETDGNARLGRRFPERLPRVVPQW